MSAVSGVGKIFTLCRYLSASGQPAVGLVLDQDEGVIGDLTDGEGIREIELLLNTSRKPKNLIEQLNFFSKEQLRHHNIKHIKLVTPVGDKQPVWAAGVTYLSSTMEREAESKQSGIYARVYKAERPELFPKAFPGEVVGPNDGIGIRSDSTWDVPEPELVIVFNSRGEIVGYTIGNDMSSRSIEGENPLYLSQAKIYEKSCAVGPWLKIGPSEEEVRTWTTSLEIAREGKVAFKGGGKIADMKRSFGDLSRYLFLAKKFPHGVALSTGTNTIPPSDFTLKAGDVVKINISGIGNLENIVIRI